MEGGDQARLRSFLGELGHELRQARNDFDEISRQADLILIQSPPPPPDKPNLLRKYIEPRRTLRRRSSTTVRFGDEFEQLKAAIAQLGDTNSIEAVERRMREVNDPFTTQIACERRRMQLAAGACIAALGRLQTCIEKQRLFIR